MLTRRIPNFRIRLNDKLLRIAAAAALFGLLVPGLAAAQAPPTPPPWNPGGGTVDPKDPNLWHNPKDGPSDYVWNPKICRWVYKAAGKDAVGNHKAGDVATQGPPQGVPPGTGKMTGPGTAKDGSGNTYTWDDDTTDTKGVVTPGKGWVDDKTGKPLCTPPAAAAVAPGANPGPAPQNVPGQGVAPVHTSVTPPPGTTPGAVPASVTPAVQTLGRAYYNTPYNSPFYNTPYNTPYNAPYYNSPLEELFDFYNTPYNTPIESNVNTLNGWYLGVDGGASFLPTYNATEFFPDGRDRFPWGSSVGSYFGAQVGRQTGNLRFEGQFTWSSNSAAPTTPLADDVKLGGGTDAYGLFVNGIYTPPFTFPYPVKPHIGVGFGALDVTTKININDDAVFNSSGWAPAAQAIGGLTWTISPRWSVDVDYRYQTTLSDVEYQSLKMGDLPRNKVTAPYESHYVTVGLNLHFPVGTRPPAPATPPPPPAPKSELPQAHQVASLVPADASRTAVTTTGPAPAQSFTLRYDAADAVLTPESVRALHDALDAIEAGQKVRIAIAGCETGADYAAGSPCARHALHLRRLMARHGVEDPDRFLVRG